MFVRDHLVTPSIIPVAGTIRFTDPPAASLASQNWCISGPKRTYCFDSDANHQWSISRLSKAMLIGFIVGDRKTSQLLPWVRLEFPHPGNTKVNGNDKKLQWSKVVALKCHKSFSQVVVLARENSQETNNIADVDAVVHWQENFVFSHVRAIQQLHPCISYCRGNVPLLC